MIIYAQPNPTVAPIHSLNSSFTRSHTWPHCKIYLENLLIQDPGPEHGDTVGVDGSLVTPEERLGDLLLTVDDDGDRLLLHTDGHAMPPGQGHKKQKWDMKQVKKNQ